MVAGDGIQEHDRAARNQSLFREYNEHLQPINAAHNWVDPPYADWVCECADEACDVPVQLTVAEYEAVRSDPHRFFVAPSDDHVVTEVERVVERQERYWVVEKIGRAAEVTERFDPRARKVKAGKAEVEAHELERVAWNLPEARRSPPLRHMPHT
jgi:hypothetical protein